MTGEVTLQGRVLPVGGIREKCLAALNLGITNVIVPITQGLQSLRDLLLPGGSGEPLATALPWLIVQPLAWLVLGALLFRIGGSIARSGGLLNRY